MKGRAAALLLAAGAAAVFASPARALPGILEFLTGDSPDSTAAQPAGSDLFLQDPAWCLDRGFLFAGDFVEHLAGGNAALTGVEGVPRPFDLDGRGRGRTPLLLDGLPVGDRVVHWDDYTWLPVRALSVIEAPRAASTEGPAAAGLRLATLQGQARPASTIALSGGDFGQRLAEFDFSRTFGSTAFHADAADFKHDGVAAYGPVKHQRGFGRFDFPIAGFAATVTAALATGQVEDSPFLGAGIEKTKDNRLTARVNRKVGAGTGGLSLFRQTDRLEVGELAPEPFLLETDQWRFGGDYSARTGARGRVQGEVFLGHESRRGVLSGNAGFWDLGGAASARAPLGDWRFEGRAALRYREPAGTRPEGAFSAERRLGRGASLQIRGGFYPVFPALPVHVEDPLPKSSTLAMDLAALEAGGPVETHYTAGIGASAGARLSGGVFAAATRIVNPFGFCTGTADAGPCADAADLTVGSVALAGRWEPRPDFEAGLRGGWQSFDTARRPYEPNLEAEGWLTLRRVYFKRDLDLSGTLSGRLIGERTSSDGAVYPSVAWGVFTLTGRIRALTLFWRIENFSRQYVESDLNVGVSADPAAGTVVPLPGIYNRIGATLRLLD